MKLNQFYILLFLLFDITLSVSIDEVDSNLNSLEKHDVVLNKVSDTDSKNDKIDKPTGKDEFNNLRSSGRSPEEKLNDKDNKDTNNANDEPVLLELPEPLTIDNFDQVTSEGIHFIEFFSPYCSHCKHLAPIWRQLYSDFKEEGAKLGVSIHQVDCVMSGDLCSREAIRFYPNLRLYVPNSQGTGGRMMEAYPGNKKRDVDSFKEYLVQQATEIYENSNDLSLLGNANSENSIKKITKTQNDKKLKQLTSNDLINLIQGNIERPFLVSFWPSNDKVLNEATFNDNPLMNDFFSNCPDCLNFRNLWNRVNYQLHDLVIDDKLDIGFLNCNSNQRLCKSLNLPKELNNNPLPLQFSEDNNKLKPQILMFLPNNNLSMKDNGLNIVKFNSKIYNTKNIKLWAEKLINLYEFNDIDFSYLRSNFNLPEMNLPNKDSVNDINDSIVFVYLCDNETHVEEDDLILKQLIQPIMDKSNNLFFFKSYDKKFVEILSEQEKQIKNYQGFDFRILKDERNKDKLQFDNEMFVSRTFSTYPLLLCFKKNSLITSIYNTHGSREIRNLKNILNFIDSNEIPTISELNDNNKELIIPKKLNKTIRDKSEKILITFYDSSNLPDLFNKFYYLTFIQHKYNFKRFEIQYSNLKQQRDFKKYNVQTLRENNADSYDIVEEYRQKISNVYTNFGELKTVYIDLNNIKFHHLIYSLLNWQNINSDDLKSGDAILVSTFENKFWNFNRVTNKPLKIEDTDYIVKLLLDLNFPKTDYSKIPEFITDDGKDTKKPDEEEDENAKNVNSKIEMLDIQVDLSYKRLRNGFSVINPFSNSILTNFAILFILTMIYIIYKTKFKRLNIRNEKYKGLGILGNPQLMTPPNANPSIGKFD
ncbi:hypothetical protein B5S33_g5512 [[Candida] boidinii]|nr:hypothetical protein B5S30_g5219 [[Candida] boidinii]OWB86798.1 hypothetical protein B5S33_g5512 [[Candida] boidinii]